MGKDLAEKWIVGHQVELPEMLSGREARAARQQRLLERYQTTLICFTLNIAGPAPEFQNNGPSYTWVMESMKVTKKLLAPGMPEHIVIPVRLYSAEKESSVVPKAQEAFIARLKNGVRQTVPGSRHEIYRSPDSVLFPWWRSVLSFYAGDTAENTSR